MYDPFLLLNLICLKTTVIKTLTLLIINIKIFYFIEEKELKNPIKFGNKRKLLVTIYLNIVC